jgi:hypothetical protein
MAILMVGGDQGRSARNVLIPRQQRFDVQQVLPRTEVDLHHGRPFLTFVMSRAGSPR